MTFIVNKSPLKFLKFVVLNYNFNFVSPLQSEDEISDLSIYELLIDYKIDKDEEKGPDTYHCLLEFKINPEKDDSHKYNGYSIKVFSIAWFSIEQKEAITEAEFKNLISLSIPNFTISQLRSYLFNATTNAPLGPYLLPAIDIIDLIQKKRKQIENSD